MESNRNKIRYK